MGAQDKVAAVPPAEVQEPGLTEEEMEQMVQAEVGGAVERVLKDESAQVSEC